MTDKYQKEALVLKPRIMSGRVSLATQRTMFFKQSLKDVELYEHFPRPRWYRRVFDWLVTMFRR